MWFQTHFRQVPELWEQGWAEKFNRAPANPMDIGFRFTVEQVQEFKVPHISVLLGYAEAADAGAIDCVTPRCLPNTFLRLLMIGHEFQNPEGRQWRMI